MEVKIQMMLQSLRGRFSHQGIGALAALYVFFLTWIGDLCLRYRLSPELSIFDK
jgi:hypothetical protein